MKATYAALHYGGPAYPIHERSLPDIPIEAAIDSVLKHMGKLSGGFHLDEPTFVTLEIIGNGYVVRLEHSDLEALKKAD
jgi:hypothetical protein